VSVPDAKTTSQKSLELDQDRIDHGFVPDAKTFSQKSLERDQD